MPLPRGLDLPCPGDGPTLPAKLVLIHTTGQIEAAGHLPFDPGIERGVGFDLQLAHQGIGMQRRQLTPPPFTHPEVDQPAAQMRTVDPLGHRGVVAIRNQQRQAETVEQPFDSSFPVALVLAHLQQLTGKRHLRFGQIQRLAERTAQGDLFLVDIADPGFQASDFKLQLIVFLPSLGE